MAASIFIAAFAGYVVGIFTGILPGLHINMVANIAASLISSGLTGNFALAAFLLAMSISHVFHEFLPSVFIGVSESEAALAVMPGHRMLLQGKGRKAVMLAAFGGVLGVVALALASPILLMLIKPAYSAVKNYIAFVLIAVIIVHFLKVKTLRSLALNGITLLLASAFGLAVFRIPTLNQPLLPMFSGLFGLSSLIVGMVKQPSFPKQQEDVTIAINQPIKAAKALSVGLLASSLMGLFPALGPAQAAMLGTSAFRKIKAGAYMFLLGTVASASMLFSILTLYSFGKARNGSIVVLGNFLQLDASSTAKLLAIACVVAGVACTSTVMLSRLFLKLVRKVNYKLMCRAIMAFLLVFVFFVSGPIGVAVMVTAAAIGMVPILTRTSRQLLMCCIMAPVIGYYI